MPCIVYAMDLTVLNLAVPAISAALDPTSSQLLWIIDIYGFMVAGFLITMGTLGDRIGRRRLLLIGAAAFTAASLLAAFSTSTEMLIAMRALLGVAGATLAPSTLSLIRNMFHDERERQFAIGVWIAAFSFGAAAGPLIGGVLLEWFDWGSVFLIAVPIMVLLLLLGPKLLPEYRDPNAGRLDLASVALSLAAVLAMIYGLKQIAEAGFTLLRFAFIVTGAVLATLFVRRQLRLDYPLFDLALFRNSRFSAAVAAYGLSCLAMAGIYILIAQYLQLVLGLSPLRAGLATLPWALGFMASSLLAPKLATRVSPASILIWGLVVAAAGFLGLLVATGTAGLPAFVAATLVMSLGLGPAFTVGNEMILTAAPPERAGLASAISETSSELSGALGIALFGSLGMLVYRAGVRATMPAEFPVSDVAAALDTLGGALEVAAALPGPAAAAFAAGARESFTVAFEIAAVVGALVTLAASVIAARLLRAGR